MRVEFNRNTFFLVGLVLLFVGLQFRMLDSVVLNEPSSRFIAEKFASKTERTTGRFFQMTGIGDATPRQVVKPPKWIAWCLIAVGTVGILHALALRRAG